MGILLSYSLAVSVAIMVLFPVLHRIVNRCTSFRFNRVAIICALASALMFPFVFGADFRGLFSEDVVSSDLPQMINETTSVPRTADRNLTDASGTAAVCVTVAIIVYLSGVVILLCREAVSYIRLFWIIARSDKTRRDGITICKLDVKDVAPFSWDNYIFLRDYECADGNDIIYLHEKAHTDRRHWIDVLFADLFCIILWYNPIAWMTRQLMKLNHEFEADDAVIWAGIDTYDYQRLLVVKAMDNRSIPMANSFAADKRSFRKRVMIMSQRRSSRRPIFLVLCAVPAVALAGTALSMPVSLKLLSSISDYSFNRELSSGQKRSDAIVQGPTIDNEVRETEPDTPTVIPSPFKDQTALADIVRLSVETIRPGKDTKVNIEIVVDEEGCVKDVLTDTPDGSEIAAAIKKEFNGIRFEQMTDNGRPVEVRFNIPIQLKKQE